MLRLRDLLGSGTPLNADTREAIVVELDDLVLQLISASGARAREAFAIPEGEDLRVRETRNLVAQPVAHLDRAARERVSDQFDWLAMLYATEGRLRARHRRVDDALLLRVAVMEALVQRRGYTQANAAIEIDGDDPEGKHVDALCRHFRRLRGSGDALPLSDGSNIDDILAAIKAGREPMRPDSRRGKPRAG